MLYDHTGAPQYIGITQMGLRKRIHDYHAGGDGNSHKFSTVYNAGRLFHNKKDPRTDPKDGKTSKELRRLFARAHCKAVGIELPGMDKSDLYSTEHQVREIAPPHVTGWNDARVLPTQTPNDLIDEFLTTLDWSQDRIDAIERQAQRWHGST